MRSLRIDAGSLSPDHEGHFRSPSSESSCESDPARKQPAAPWQPVQESSGSEMPVQVWPAALASSVEAMPTSLREAKRRRKIEWSPEEDLAILTSVRKFGTQWGKIAAELQDRTADAVRNRWHRKQKNNSTHGSHQLKSAADALLSCGASPVAEESDSALSASGKRECIRGSDHGRSLWTEREDALIREGVAQHGCKWRIIASTLTGRSDSSVRNRWMRILKDVSVPPSAHAGASDTAHNGSFACAFFAGRPGAANNNGFGPTFSGDSGGANAAAFDAAYGCGAGAAQVQATPVVHATHSPESPVGVALSRWASQCEVPAPAYGAPTAHSPHSHPPPMSDHHLPAASAAPASQYDAHAHANSYGQQSPHAYANFDPRPQFILSHSQAVFPAPHYQRQLYAMPHPHQRMYPPPAPYMTNMPVYGAVYQPQYSEGQYAEGPYAEGPYADRKYAEAQFCLGQYEAPPPQPPQRHDSTDHSLPATASVAPAQPDLVPPPRPPPVGYRGLPGAMRTSAVQMAVPAPAWRARPRDATPTAA
jgi:hypothetical protein